MLKLMNMQDLVSSQNQGLPCLFSKIVATSAFCGFAYNQISLALFKSLPIQKIVYLALLFTPTNSILLLIQMSYTKSNKLNQVQFLRS